MHAGIGIHLGDIGIMKEKTREKKRLPALAEVAQWIERGPVNQRVAGSFPSQAHAWAAGQVPGWGRARGNHTLMYLSLSPSISLKIRK